MIFRLDGTLTDVSETTPIIPISSHLLTGILAATYKEIARILNFRDFEHLQGSDWYCQPTDAIDTYWAMLSLKSVRPPGKFPSTLKGLKAHYIHDWILDVTDDLQLGGMYSPELEGPTPQGLVPPVVPSAVPQQPLQVLPRNTQPSAAAGAVENWRVPP
jgi:hypothetical protein